MPRAASLLAGNDVHHGLPCQFCWPNAIISSTIPARRTARSQCNQCAPTCALSALGRAFSAPRRKSTGAALEAFSRDSLRALVLVFGSLNFLSAPASFFAATMTPTERILVALGGSEKSMSSIVEFRRLASFAQHLFHRCVLHCYG